MIINQTKTNPETEFKLLPIHYFPNHFVSVSSIYVKLDQPISNTLVSLRSTLVDRSPVNYKQEIFSFVQNESSLILFQTPTRLVHYKIQVFNIEDAVFKLAFDPPQQVKIEKIKLQLEINAGNQQIPQRPIS